MTRPLSSREREVVERIVAGESYKEIARAMGIAVGTVAAHANHAYAKVDGVRRRRRRLIKQAVVFGG